MLGEHEDELDEALKAAAGNAPDFDAGPWTSPG